MTLYPETVKTRPVWFVGAAFGGNEDQTPRFLADGIWENGHTDRYIEDVKSIQPGDRIAIKAAFTRKNGLPFDNRGHMASVMRIKAVGTVKENIGDGRFLKVDWTPLAPPREWYFFTYRGTVWKVTPGFNEWQSNSLISFAFDEEKQDIDRFRNHPYWLERFGDPPDTNPGGTPKPETEGPQVENLLGPLPLPNYTIEDIVKDGCFLELSRLESALERLNSKKNLILQGSPGTGKTWLAKKLAFALIGRKDVDRVRSFQFHPNLSYEDFVRGWRPDGEGSLALVNGPFLRTIDDAKQDPDNKYVIVIEEINRGNPAQIFGEMLTLLEADKRNPEEALALSYPRTADERVHIPPNIYLIGTMNVADRSLALVDLALRRRFAFVDLEPRFGDLWRDWVRQQCGIETDFLMKIENSLTALNQSIAGDKSLGSQFRIGHSVVTPAPNTPIGDPVAWFTQVVETEIGPLLNEYWFDDMDMAKTQKQRLLDGIQ